MKKAKITKPRNPHAAAVRDPNSPFRPKVVPDKKSRIKRRENKHKGKRYGNDGYDE